MTLRRARLLLTVGLVIATWTGVSVQVRLARPPRAHVVMITPPGLTGSEPAIAVNPGNPNQVVGVGSADFRDKRSL